MTEFVYMKLEDGELKHCLDPEVAGAGCFRMIAAATFLAWQDAVDNMGTYRDGAYQSAWRIQAKKWISSEQYSGWMELLDLDPDLLQETLLKEYGAVVMVVLNGE